MPFLNHRSGNKNQPVRLQGNLESEIWDLQYWSISSLKKKERRNHFVFYFHNWEFWIPLLEALIPVITRNDSHLSSVKACWLSTQAMPTDDVRKLSMVYYVVIGEVFISREQRNNWWLTGKNTYVTQVHANGIIIIINIKHNYKLF